MAELRLGSDTTLHHDWQIEPVGMFDIKDVKDAYKYCEAMSKGCDSPAHFMTAVIVMYNAVAEHYNKHIDQERFDYETTN